MERLGKNTMGGFLKGLASDKAGIMDFIREKLGSDVMANIGTKFAQPKGKWWEQDGKWVFTGKDNTNQLFERGKMRFGPKGVTGPKYWAQEIGAPLANPKTAWHQVISGIKDHFGIPGLASGGVTTGPTLAEIGEKGRGGCPPAQPARHARPRQADHGADAVPGARCRRARPRRSLGSRRWRALAQ